MDWNDILLMVLKAGAVIGVVMTLAGYSVLAERKIAGWIQGRPGPNRTTIPLIAAIPVIGRLVTRLGILQLPADGGKFLFKEDPVPGHVNKLYYFLAPALAFLPAMVILTVIPFGEFTNPETGLTVPLALTNLDVGILFILAVSSLGVYGIILAGWASNSKYPFLGAIRSSAQMISYEIAMGLAILPVLMWAGTLNLGEIVALQDGAWWGVLPKWSILYQPLTALLFMVALFAETNRLPFDMPESETDLVAGYHTEYGAFKFGLFFVGEYAHIVIGGCVFTLLFLGGWQLPWVDFPAGILGGVLSTLVFLGKVLAIVFFFIWVRWTLPRFRYDQVMHLGWKVLLPLALANLLFYAIAIAVFETLARS